MKSLTELYAMFAAYNAWANERIYDAAARLPPEDYAADRGAFFRSVRGTLNHLLVTDRIWMRRFTGAGEAPATLDAILFEDFAPLRDARRAEDSRIIAFVEGLDAEGLAGQFTYRTISRPVDITQALSPALSHLFNHQTHHRGQVHALLTGFGLDAPGLDLIQFQRDTGIGLR